MARSTRSRITVDSEANAPITVSLASEDVAVHAFTDRIGGTEITLPLVVSSRTNLWVAKGTYTVTCMWKGVVVKTVVLRFPGANSEANVTVTKVDIDLAELGNAIGSGGGGGSSIAIGRPKLADNTVFYGLPFGFNDDGHWQGWPDTQHIGAFEQGIVYYTLPIVHPDAIHIDELVVIAATPASDGVAAVTDDIRVALVAADENWRPIGPPIYQGVVTFDPDVVSDHDEMELPDSSFDLPAGRYMYALEEAYGGSVASGATLQCTTNQGQGTLLCTGLHPGQMIENLKAAHTYGVFTDPMPIPSDIIAGPTTAGSNFGAMLLNRPMYPVLANWTPA